MAADAGALSYGAVYMPCLTRRQVLAAAGDPTVYNFFPKDGQFIDSPALVTPRWTSDRP